MSLESADLDESSLADVAGERLLPGVGAVVDPEVGRRDERPLARRAPVRPLFRVDPHVQLEVARLDELAIADAALVRLYAGVRAMVNLHTDVETLGWEVWLGKGLSLIHI